MGDGEKKLQRGADAHRCWEGRGRGENPGVRGAPHLLGDEEDGQCRERKGREEQITQSQFRKVKGIMLFCL